jgi:hypothetical protein
MSPLMSMKTKGSSNVDCHGCYSCLLHLLRVRRSYAPITCTQHLLRVILHANPDALRRLGTAKPTEYSNHPPTLLSRILLYKKSEISVSSEEEGNALPERVLQIHADGHRSKFQVPGRRGKAMFLFRIGFLTPAGSQITEHAVREEGERRPPVKCTGAT